MLGHRRLSIIDRAGGAQPLTNEDRSRWIVFNGEIYNHHTLRQQLVDRGHQFRTMSDTETILHGYEEYGPAVVDRLDGMFAFAVYDTRARELFIARDRLGKKPLFYAVLGGVLHFASEIKALYPSPVWDGSLDVAALEDYLALGYILAPQTIYRHVRKLEPGHWLRVVNGRVEERQYWDVTEFDQPIDDAHALTELESRVRAAVTQRLESEVPLGAFLSGGIDSGLVASFMAETLGSDITTTSVGFSDAAHNELAAAGETARHFGTTHHEAVVEPRLDDVLDRIVAAFDEPFADPSAIPTYYLSRMARQHVTVALSGDGGDETFGGYDFRYLPHAWESQVRQVAGAVGRRALGWAGSHWPRNPRMPRAFRLAPVLENIARDPASAYYYDLCFVKPNTVRTLMGLPAVDLAATHAFAAVTDPYRRCQSSSSLQRAMYADLKVYLPNDVLVKVDRMSMQHGLEVRCPLLDRSVVEWGFRTPIDIKMPGLRPKHLLKSLASRRLPERILSLPKRGFSAPAQAWIAEDYAERFRVEVLSPRSPIAGMLDMHLVNRMFDEHRRGHRLHTQALWAIWMLERWASTVNGGTLVGDAGRTPVATTS